MMVLMLCLILDREYIGSTGWIDGFVDLLSSAKSSRDESILIVLLLAQASNLDGILRLPDEIFAFCFDRHIDVYAHSQGQDASSSLPVKRTAR